ncbi:MAG: 2-oxoacid:acceptor oxidoreductase family protein [Deltaproteobacteria bacterium]|nr:MAG: 2-oxoacid:acceptor oxidoreductase family protein [Deltaproteobacteria bacterium]
MYCIRLHGRGGQGMKTASRILGSAFFEEGFEVQDAPRYGAERRGAPIFAYVRAARRPILERGIIRRPDLVVVADETLVPVSAAGVVQGVGPYTVLLIHSAEAPAVWKRRLKLGGEVFTLPVAPEDRADVPLIGASCAGAAARLVGEISRDALEEAIRSELVGMRAEVVAENLERALGAYDRLAPHAGCVREGDAEGVGPFESPDWIDLPFEDARISAPDIHAGGTSVQVRTGLWRTMRPLIDLEHCHRCAWVCSTFCPDGAIRVDDAGAPQIDYDHCKGCLVCVAVCPPHAIHAIPEEQAADAAAAENAA